ncbi:hypothetical protein GCM10009559_59100 [Pseudonocardia zijingensis]|uniref:Uncharacterized protein n=1 Tax=Pseudonocardia zijingensis TaxID=153376 RepID=A0ABP3YQG9_9PSEU
MPNALVTTCPQERFESLGDAQATLAQRRARAALSGSPHTIRRYAYHCRRCHGAHITRSQENPSSSPDGGQAR